MNMHHYPVLPTDDLGKSCYWVCAKEDGHFGYLLSYDTWYQNYPVDTTYAANTWYHIKLEFDYSQQKFWVWINENSVTPNGLPAKNHQGNVGSYLTNWRMFNVHSTGTGTMWADGLKVITPGSGGVSGYLEDFNDGQAQGWTVTGLWHITNYKSYSSPNSLAYNQESTHNYDTGSTNSGEAVSPSITLSSSPSLTFKSWYNTEEEGTSWDKKLLYISTDGGSSWTQIYQVSGTSQQWQPITISLSNYAGQTIKLKFKFDTIDNLCNNYGGWYIDDFVINGNAASGKRLDGLNIYLSDWYESYAISTTAYSWIETSSSTGITSDDQSKQFSLLFNFNFYGVDYNSMWICSNGFLSFTSSSTDCTPDSIPNTGEPNAIIVPLWRDLDPSNGGSITYRSWSDKFVVTWDQVPNYGDTDKQTFQVIIYSNGTVVYNYKSITNDVPTSVGAENQNGTMGISWSSSDVQNNFALKLSHTLQRDWVREYVYDDDSLEYDYRLEAYVYLNEPYLNMLYFDACLDKNRYWHNYFYVCNFYKKGYYNGEGNCYVYDTATKTYVQPTNGMWYCWRYVYCQYDDAEDSSRNAGGPFYLLTENNPGFAEDKTYDIDPPIGGDESSTDANDVRDDFSLIARYGDCENCNYQHASDPLGYILGTKVSGTHKHQNVLTALHLRELDKDITTLAEATAQGLDIYAIYETFDTLLDTINKAITNEFKIGNVPASKQLMDIDFKGVLFGYIVGFAATGDLFHFEIIENDFMSPDRTRAAPRTSIDANPPLLEIASPVIGTAVVILFNNMPWHIIPEKPQWYFEKTFTFWRSESNKGKYSGDNQTNCPINDNSDSYSSIKLCGQGTVSNINVQVDIIHTYIGDLQIWVKSPDGTEYLIWNRQGGSADNIHQPFNIPSGLDGKQIKGEWKLHVKDCAGGDTGYIDYWKIEIES